MITPARSKRDRRKMGRPKNPNIPPADTTLKVRKSTLYELDKIINYPLMPLGRKLESLIAEVKIYRKNLGSQSPTNSPRRQELNALLVINNQGNESIEQQFDRELAELSNGEEDEPDADETNNGDGEDDEPEFYKDKWEERGSRYT